jgi:subtilisin family serine protease
MATESFGMYNMPIGIFFSSRVLNLGKSVHRIFQAVRFAALAFILVALSGWSGGLAFAQPTRRLAHTALDAQAAKIEQAQQADGTTRVVVALRMPAASRAVGARQQVSQAQNRVIEALSNTPDFQLVHRYQTIPGLVGVVSSQGLESLRQHPDVQAVALDMQIHATLTESVALIRADRVWNELGLTGAGINVAVLDSGVDRTHPDLADHIVAQHCFSKGDCPPNGADEGENAQDENGHGTHVAGIITSRGSISPRGVAPDAGIVAVRVMDKTGSGWNSDLVAGIDWVVANQVRLNVRVINMSLGAGRYADVCDAQDANTMLQAAALGAARQAGIVAFAASGNDGQANAMSAPACVSGVVSVGATYDANLGPKSWSVCSDANATTDQVACFSNSSPALDLLAPGAVIVSTALGGGKIGESGTSMASPHVAAVAALMLQAYPGLTPSETEAVLESAGVPVTDRRNSRVTPRIDALAAATRVISDHVPTSSVISGTVLLQGRADYADTIVYLTQEPCAAQPSQVPISGTLSAATDAQGHFEVVVLPGKSYQCLQAVRRGYLVGQKNAPQGAVGTITLLGGDMTGDDTINIFDLALVASRFGGNDPAADVNGDGMVNIFDLTLVASNFGRVGPVTDWH